MGRVGVDVFCVLIITQEIKNLRERDSSSGPSPGNRLQIKCVSIVKGGELSYDASFPLSPGRRAGRERRHASAHKTSHKEILDKEKVTEIKGNRSHCL